MIGVDGLSEVLVRLFNFLLAGLVLAEDRGYVIEIDDARTIPRSVAVKMFTRTGTKSFVHFLPVDFT